MLQHVNQNVPPDQTTSYQPNITIILYYLIHVCVCVCDDDAMMVTGMKCTSQSSDGSIWWGEGKAQSVQVNAFC